MTVIIPSFLIRLFVSESGDSVLMITYNNIFNHTVDLRSITYFTWLLSFRCFD